jgi:hypothetical protein
MYLLNSPKDYYKIHKGKDGSKHMHVNNEKRENKAIGVI